MNRKAASLLMLANAGLVFYLAWSGGKIDENFSIAVLWALALGLLSLLLAVRLRGFVVVLARGVAIALIITFGFLALFSGAVFSLGTGPRAWVQLLLGIIPIVVQVLLLRALPFSGESRARRTLKNVAGTVLAFFLALVVTWVAALGKELVWFARIVPRVAADSVMRASIPRVQACAVAFAKAHGGYPASLADIGPAPSGSGCLDSAQASGRLGRVTLTYVAGAPDSDGVRRTFQVYSSGHIGYQHGEPWMSYGDETGIIRAGDSASVSAIQVIHGGMQVVRTARACANLRRLAHPSTGYPRNFGELYEVRETDGEETMRWLGCYYGGFAFNVNFDTTNSLSNVGRYTPIGDSVVTDYVMEIRPRKYGVTGVRSIRTTAHGPVYSTVENRPATEQDPVVPTCEYEFRDETCVPEAGGVPADVDVVIPDTVALGEKFTVKITDARPKAQRQHPYQYAVLCNYKEFGGPPPPPATYTFSPPTTCVADSPRVNGPWVIVRVWVRDYSTTETSIYRRAQLAR